ncbi:MAG: DUF58 domain-containing protein [Actinomycetia bacterium]|nr:DUF58 domain-containing protein [Actinomycetes bacterium]
MTASPAIGWTPTPALVRSVLGALVLAAAAVLARRPDVLVIATPLVVAAVWAVVTRPTVLPEVSQSVGHPTLHEGEATTWRTAVADPHRQVEDLAVVFEPSAWVEHIGSVDTRVVALHDDSDQDLAIAVRPTRWGRHRIKPALVVASSAWNGYRWVHRRTSDPIELLALPRPYLFDAANEVTHARGLVGNSRSPRPGAGSEFEGVRTFAPGDRLRRIHWPESLRTGTLHVTTSWADEDQSVLLLVDAFDEIGHSGGVDGFASSLDIATRAAAAMAEFHTKQGDRVALVTVGGLGARRLAPRSGYPHLRRLLQVLAEIEPVNAPYDDGRMPGHVEAGARVVAFSPLLSPATLRRLTTLAGRGFSVVAIDCFPPDITISDPGDPYAQIAWRIELLKRERHLRAIRATGVPVVAWNGRGSLDLVLGGPRRAHSRRVRFP